MKIFAELTRPYWEETPKLFIFALDWYKHRRKEWRGFTFSIVLFNRMLIITVVDNYAEYDRIMNRRYRKK